jgi:hypothetical protein
MRRSRSHAGSCSAAATTPAATSASVAPSLKTPKMASAWNAQMKKPMPRATATAASSQASRRGGGARRASTAAPPPQQLTTKTTSAA